MLSDKSIQSLNNKELNNKLQNSYKNLRDLIYHKQTRVHYSDYFETLLTQLPLDAGDKQNEVSCRSYMNNHHSTYTYSSFQGS